MVKRIRAKIDNIIFKWFKFSLKRLLCSSHNYELIDSGKSGAYGCIPTIYKVYKCTKCGKTRDEETFLSSWEEWREINV